MVFPLRRPSLLAASVVVVSAILVAGGCARGADVREAGSEEAGRDQSRSPTEPETPSPDPDAFVANERVCAFDDFDMSAGACTTDLGRDDLDVDDIACSVQIAAEAGDVVDVEMLWDDTVVVTRSVPLQAEASGSGRATANTFLDVGDLEIPGGTYQCRFTINAETHSVDFTVDGPTQEPFSNWGCAGDQLMLVGETTHCAEDDADSILTGVTSLGFSVLFADVQGEPIDVAIAYAGPAGQTGGTDDLTAGSQLGIVAGNVPVDAALTGGAPGDPMAPGDYTATWIVAGETVAERTLTVQ